MTRLGSIASFCFLVAVALPLSAAVAAVPPWSSEHDAGLGFTYSYPHGLFSRIAGDGKQSFHYFVSPNSEAKLMVGAWNNREGRTPTGFKHWLLANAGGYDELTYRPRGRSWFVLSGYRGHDIYYENVFLLRRGGERLSPDVPSRPA
jgi:hypothetical protein